MIIDESPRFLLINKKFNAAFKNLNRIISFNKGDKIENYINNEEKEDLIEWANNQRFKNLEEGDIFSLISSNYIKISILIWINSFIISIIYYGLVYIFPIVSIKILMKSFPQDNNFNLVIYASLFSITLELFSYTLNPFIIENKFLGRRKTILIAYLITGIMLFISIFGNVYIFLIAISIARAISGIIQDTVSVLSSEVYPTKLRNTGVSIGLGFMKISGSVMTYLTVFSFNLYGEKGPSIVLFVICLFGLISMLFFKYETLGLPLDRKNYEI